MGEFQPGHGDLVYVRYLHNRKTESARAIRYRNNYLGIRVINKRINDPVVSLYDIPGHSIEEIYPLDDQTHEPTGIEKAVQRAILSAQKTITVDLPIKKE